MDQQYKAPVQTPSGGKGSYAFLTPEVSSEPSRGHTWMPVA